MMTERGTIVDTQYVPSESVLDNDFNLVIEPPVYLVTVSFLKLNKTYDNKHLYDRYQKNDKVVIKYYEIYRYDDDGNQIIDTYVVTKIGDISIGSNNFRRYII